jgi:hypothetical protein
MMESPSEAWARCKGYVLKALEAADHYHSLADVEADIEAGRAHFWWGPQSAVITQVVDHPGGSLVNIWLCGGKLSEMVTHHLPNIEFWAKQHGCTAIMGSGRDAWTAAAKKCGFTPGHVTFEKVL